MGLAFVPLYIHYLGIESYGLIGVFSLLQSLLVVLDMGLTPTLGREMARFRAGEHTPRSIHELFRSLEIASLVLAIVTGSMLTAMAPWLAGEWVRAEHLSQDVVTQALAIMGSVVALSWLASLYRGAILGLQRQVWLNGCIAIFATVRGVGVLAVLAWISPTIQAFFIFQCVAALVETVVLAIQIRRWLPRLSGSAKLAWTEFRRVSRFAAGMTTIALLSIILVQADKMILSKLLSLTEFGYYTLAATVAGALLRLVYPVTGAAYPRLVELIGRGDTTQLKYTYHRLSQLITIVVVPAALVVSTFSEHFLLLWTRDPTVTAAVHPLVSLLVIGTMLNALVNLPYLLQLAHGRTRLAIGINIVAIMLLVPSLYVGVSHYGAIAAAVAWVVLNTGYVVFGVPLMHRYLLPDEMRRWYWKDVFLPAFGALAATAAVRFFAPSPVLANPVESALIVSSAALLAILAAIIASPVRSELLNWCRQYHE